MPINPIGVPQPRAIAQVQLPKVPDASQLFFQRLAGLQGQQKLQQDANNSLSNVAMAFSTLLEKQRATNLDNQQAGAMLDLHKAQLGLAQQKQDESDRLSNFLMSAQPQAANFGGKGAVVTQTRNGQHVQFDPLDKADPMAAAKAKAGAHNADGLSQLNDLSRQWDQLGAGISTQDATVQGTKLKAMSMFPSTAAGQYDANAQLFAGKLDHDLLGRVNDLTIGNAKKSIFGFYDTPASKASKLKTLQGIYAQAQASPRDPNAIKAAYKAKRLTLDQANAMLDEAD